MILRHVHMSCVLLAVLAVVPTALATSFYEQPFPEAVNDAPVIVRGKVGDKTTDWSGSEDGYKRIYTFYDLQVTELLKGSASSKTIKMRELGGEKDGRGMQVAGAANFSSGEDVVVFLGERNDDGSHDVFGMMMGKFEIRKDADGSEYLVGPGIVHHGVGGQADTDSAKKWTLDAVRKLIESQGGRPKPLEQRESAPKPVTTQQVAPTPTAAPTANLASPQASESSAPQLQPQPDGRSWGLEAALVAAALAAVALFAILRRRR